MVWNEQLKRNIPLGWQVVSIREISDIIWGQCPDGKNILDKTSQSRQFFKAVQMHLKSMAKQLTLFTITATVHCLALHRRIRISALPKTTTHSITINPILAGRVRCTP